MVHMKCMTSQIFLRNPHHLNLLFRITDHLYLPKSNDRASSINIEIIDMELEQKCNQPVKHYEVKVARSKSYQLIYPSFFFHIPAYNQTL